MNEKEIYQIYVGVMKIHKKYADHVRDSNYLSAMIADINQLNSTYNSNFCNAMTDALRRWMAGKIQGVEPEKIKELYTELWLFHKKYLNQERTDAYWSEVVDGVDVLAKKYGTKQVELFLLAVADELESDKTETQVNEPPDGQKDTEAGRTNNEQKKEKHPNQ